MEIKDFRNKLDQYKKAREKNPQLSYWQWKQMLPSNLADTPDWQYNNVGAWSGGLTPELNEDGYYHLGSRNPITGEILKPKTHSTYQKAIENDIAAGYYPYEKNGRTYTKTYSPTGDLSGYSEGTGEEGIVDELKRTKATELTPEQKEYLRRDYARHSRKSGAIQPAFSIQDVADFTPVGDAVTAKEAYDATTSGNYITAGLLGLSLVAPPVIDKAVKRAIPSVTRSFASKYNALKAQTNKERQIFSDAIEQRNRTIEDMYFNKELWDRAEQIKKQYGTDYPSVYRNIIDAYENRYYSLPEPVIKDLPNDAKARMSAKPSAIKEYVNTGKPAGIDDFEYQIDRNINDITQPTTRHELGHYADFNISGSSNIDANNEMFKALKQDLSTKQNPIYPDMTDYFSLGSEQKSYMNTLREYMLQTGTIHQPGQKVSTKKLKRVMDTLPEDMKAVKAAYQQFENPNDYAKWFNKIPLLGTIPFIMNYKDEQESN